jgi:hypothetical protein
MAPEGTDAEAAGSRVYVNGLYQGGTPTLKLV